MITATGDFTDLKITSLAQHSYGVHAVCAEGTPKVGREDELGFVSDYSLMLGKENEFL
jgi:hypothetical protein